MQIGVIGAVTVGWTLATKFAARGHEVLLANSRGPDSLAEAVARQSQPLRPATAAEAAACELVLLAVPWTRVRDALPPGLAWSGRILVDATNIFKSYAPGFEVDAWPVIPAARSSPAWRPGRGWSRHSTRCRSPRCSRRCPRPG